MKDNLLNLKILDQIEKYKNSTIHHIIGVDQTFDNVTSYCLVREITDGPTEILLTNSVLHNGDQELIGEIEIEIVNLAKYFKAKVIRQK